MIRARASLRAGALALGLLAGATAGASQAGAQTAGPAFPTPIPAATPVRLKGVELMTLPDFSPAGSARALSRFERKQLMLFVPHAGNETAIVGTPAEVDAQVQRLYAARSAESEAIRRQYRAIQTVPLRGSIRR